LTRDTDFFDRIMLDGSSPKVIWVRLGNIRKRDLESKLLQLWPSIVNLLEDSDLVEIHPDSLEAVKKSE
jgi:predicted nuclease of predicted toxin-antitoxin system